MSRVVLLATFVATYVLLVVDAAAFNPNPAKFWWFNTFLEKQTIGRFEPSNVAVGAGVGPCPQFNEDRCEVNFATLPASVKAIGVSLPAPFSGALTVGQALPTGKLRFYRTEINDASIDDTIVQGFSVNPSTHRIRIDVKGFRANVRTALSLYGLTYPFSASIDEIEATALRAGQAIGTDIQFDVFVQAPVGQTLSTAFVRNATLGNCSIELDLSLTVSKVTTVYPFANLFPDVANFLIQVAEPLLGDGVCGAIRQLFTTFQGGKGVINELIEDAFDRVGNLTNRPAPTLAGEEAAFTANLSPAQKAGATRFAGNTIVKGASTILNNWLGAGGFNPVINEVVNLLTMPDNGTAVFRELNTLGLALPVTTAVAKVTVELLNITASGLNTFSSPYGLQILKNNYDNLLPQLNYTLDNKVSLDSIRLNIQANLIVDRNAEGNGDGITNGWIYMRPPLGLAQTRMFMNISIALSDLDVAVAFAVASDPSQLKTIQIGQLLGKQDPLKNPLEQILQGSRCGSPALYGAALPFLEINLGNVVTPRFDMIPEDIGVEKIVNDVSQIVVDVGRSVLIQDIDLISQHWVRPLINTLLRDNIVAGGTLATCPDYEDQGKFTPNLQSSFIFRVAKEVIRDVVGGDPVRNSPASINELVKQVVLFGCEVFASPSSCQLLAPGRWRFVPSLTFFPGKTFPKVVPFDSSIAVTGLNLNGVNSVYRLLLNNVGTTTQGVNLLLELGQVNNPLQIILQNQWKVNYFTPFTKLDVFENFNLTIAIVGFRVNVTVIPDFDLNQLYLLRLEDVVKSACVLAPLASMILDLRLSSSSFQVNITNTPDPVFSNVNNDLRLALNQVILDQQSGYSTLNTMFNFVLTSVGKFANNAVMGISNSVINSTNCALEDNAFDTFVTRLLFATLTANLTDVFIKATGVQPLVPSAALLDAGVSIPFGSSPFNLQESFFVPLINDAVAGTGQQAYNELLQTLANGTGDVLSDSFALDPDGSVRLDINFTQYDFFKDGFDLSFLIENATFYLYQVKLTKLTNVDMSTIRVADPISKFVTETRMNIPGTMNFFISFGIKLPKSFKGQSGPPVTTVMTFSTDLTDLDIDVMLLTALDAKRVNGLSVGNFISVDANQKFSLNDNGITCLLRLFLPRGLTIPKLEIGLADLGNPTITASTYEFISQGTIQTLQAMIRIIADFYVKDLKDITQGGLRVLINNYLLEPNLERPGFCRNPPPPPLFGNNRILNFKASESITFVNDLTTNYLAGRDGKYSLLNRVIGAAFNARRFFRAPEHELAFNNLSIVYKKSSLGRISGAFRDLGMPGLGTFKSINLVQATSNTSINNNLSFTGPFDVTFGLKWVLQDLIVGNLDGLTDEIQATLTMTNVTIGVGFELALDIPDLLIIQAGSFTNFSQIACVLTAVRNFSLNNFELDVGKIGTKLECSGLCESPLFKGIATGVPLDSGNSNFANIIPNLIELVVTFLNGPGFGNQAQQAIEDADRSCAAALNLTTAVKILNANQAEGLNVAVIFGLALIGIGCALAVLAPLAIPRHYQLKDKMLAQNLLKANSQPGANAQSVARYMAKMERDQIALAWHPAVSTCCKCFVPFMAIANVILLALSFVVYLSFSMDSRLYLFGSVTKTYTLVPWTIASTVNDMWNSGAWPLSVLIIFASCAWPVVKNIALFAIWFAPKTFLNHEKRHYYLVQLDVLGKWSFLDVYIVNILVGGLRFTLYLSDAPLLQIFPIPQQLFVIDVIVTPGIGIVLLCIAAFMSLVVNHIIIWELEKAEWADRRLFKQIDGYPDDMLTPKAGIRLSISEYVFSTTAPNGQRDRYGPKAKNSVIMLLCSAMVFLIVGMSVPYFSFTYDGLVGIAVGFFIEGGRKKTFTLFSFGAVLPASSTGETYMNVLMLFFTVLYFATVVIGPLLQMILHLVLWLRPLSIKDANTIFFFSKVAAYWAAMEVFALGIIATTIEIKPVTFFLVDFITGGTCSALRQPLTNAIGERNGNCLLPGAILEWGFGVAFVANLYQIGVGAIMIRASGVALRDRTDILEHQPHKRWTMAEYLVLDKLLVHGAAHHKPIPDPDAKPGLLSRLFTDCQTNPTAACSACGAALCAKMNVLEKCCSGVDDVGLSAPITAKSNKVGNSKWNTPSSHQPSTASKWNAPSATPSWNMTPSANPSWNMSQPGAQQSMSRGMVMNDSMNMDSPNPVFAREQQSKRYSVDV